MKQFRHNYYCPETIKLTLIILFLLQAMGVYLYGELMVNEDANQQELAYKSFATVRDQMDVSAAKIVTDMLF